MAMGLGVGSEEVSDPAEGPLGRGEEPDWVTGTGRRARRARRRIRQRVRKRRVLAVDEMDMKARLAHLEARSRAHKTLLDTLGSEVGAMSGRTDFWLAGLDDLYEEVRAGLKGASATMGLIEGVSAQMAELSWVVMALAKGIEDLHSVTTENREILERRYRM